MIRLAALREWLSPLFWLLATLGVCFFAYWFSSRPALRLTEIYWKSEARPITRETDLQAALSPHVPLGFFFQQSLQPLAQRLLEIPWISAVQLKKCWPNQLRIALRERSIFAHWNQQWYLDEHGACFSVPADRVVSINRCHLSGPEGTEKKMIAALKSIETWIPSSDLRVTALRCSQLGEWQVDLGEKWMLLIGNEKELYLQIKRFLWWLPKLQMEIDKHASGTRMKIDFRYANGVAISYLTVPHCPPLLTDK